AVMPVLMCWVPANAALNWVLIYGHLGAPPLGVAGAGIASPIVQWLMFGGLALYISAMRSVRTLLAFGRTRALDWHDVKDLLRLGAPIGGILALAVGVFVAAGVLVGLISADALGANPIVFNVASLTFIGPMGVSQAATARCAVTLRAQRPAPAWRAPRAALPRR